ncbi:hypothetical protein MHBO_003013 [Bonamia ostreae]|uniref:K Homology domain-containing protein n=1 Tax=Bonamia ostreae TaxID=126728 RepID=A0ABV2AP86_9EUKA
MDQKSNNAKSKNGENNKNDKKLQNYKKEETKTKKKRRSRFDDAPPGQPKHKKIAKKPVTKKDRKMEKILKEAEKFAEKSRTNQNSFEARIPIPDELVQNKAINFVGLVIGPSGMTQKKLQRDLQCRVNMFSKKITISKNNYFLMKK